MSGKTKIIPPFYGARAISNIPADEVFACLDKRVLFNLAWKAHLKDKEEARRLIEEEYKPLLQELKEEAIRKRWLDLKAVYGYFKCRTSGEDMEILNRHGETLEKINFPRSNDEKGLSLADYFSVDDIVAFQAVTVGSNFSAAIEELNEKGETTRAFLLHGLSVHLAEALAEYIHSRIRLELKLKIKQGKRYSPGYPLWNRIEDQEKLFRLLDVRQTLNIQLTEGHQMVPEQSTTAMIVHNNKAEH